MADKVNGKGIGDEGHYEPPALKRYKLVNAVGGDGKGDEANVRKEGWSWVYEGRQGPKVELEEEQLGDVEMMLWRLESGLEMEGGEKKEFGTGNGTGIGTTNA